MHAKELLELERRDIRALHYTWIAFFLTFYVWFNMAPLATSMLQTESYLTPDHIKLFLIANVALTIPGRVIVGMALDRFGPRRVFSILMVVMAIPTWFFAFGNSATQLFVWRASIPLAHRKSKAASLALLIKVRLYQNLKARYLKWMQDWRQALSRAVTVFMLSTC